MTALAILPIDTNAPPRRLAYQAQDSPLTLAQGLAEYYAANEGRVMPPASLAPDSAALFGRHDICHVIFGLDTTIADEAMADTRTMVSCDVGFAAYANYLRTNADTQAVFKQVGYAKTAWITLKTIPRMLRAAIDALGMTKRWPWTPPESYMNRTLADLRAEYGIRIL